MSKLRIASRYGIAPNELLNSSGLTFKAKGLYTYIQSKPDGWNFSAERIARDSRDNISSVTTAIKELEKYGYLKRDYDYKDGKKTVEYILYPEPTFEKPTHENQRYENQTHENQVNNKEGDLQIKSLIKQEDNIYPSFDDFWGLYDKKRDKIACEKKWATLTQQEKKDAMNFIPKYKASQPDIQYRKDPIRFLKNKTWNDEIDPTQLFPKDSLQAHTIQQPVPSNTDWREREKYWEEQTRLERQQLK